jgi:hypothetical protein
MTASRLWLQPPFDDRPQRSAVEPVELESPLPLRRHQAGAFEHFEMLRDGLPGRTDAVLHREPAAKLEERLTVPVDQLVEDCAPRRVGDGSKQFIHVTGKPSLAFRESIRKLLLACQVEFSARGCVCARHCRPHSAGAAQAPERFRPLCDVTSDAVRFVGGLPTTDQHACTTTRGADSCQNHHAPPAGW